MRRLIDHADSTNWTMTEQATARAGHPRAARATRVVALVVALAYLVGISWYLLAHGGWPTIDYLVPPLLLLAITLGRGWQFVLDWGPFLLLVLLWQATAGIADQLGQPVHLYEPAEADYLLFQGRLPTAELQQRLFDPNRAHWYDWAATLQHAFHFVLPVIVGLALWLRSRRCYWRYLASVVLLFAIGFAGYALYPAAPPWMAGLLDVTPPVDRVAVETVRRLPASAPIGLVYTHFSANEVAAIPSLHAALPMLIALILVRLFGPRALPALLYPLTMGFNLVYLGEHYVIDVLIGYGVALLAFLVVWVAPDALPRARIGWRVSLPRIAVPVGVRRAAGATLPALAVLSIAVIAFSLRPSRPVNVAGPVIPGLQVQAGQSDLASLSPCDTGSSSGISADPSLDLVAERYSVYLFDLVDDACYLLAANETFPRPLGTRVQALAERAPVPLAAIPRSRGSLEHYALYTGLPSPSLIDAGLQPHHRYLAVIALGGVTDTDAARLAVEVLMARALQPEG